ncbi:Efm4 protein [Martiniozyma asiatica (nom. inval.)]|nr:Efm4 protein [Martiniozyma asiatica]
MENADTMKLQPSKLGTKKYWDDFYTLEKQNFSENPEDVGECWFSDSNAEDRICEFVFTELPSLNDLKVCDLGTGNGHLLFQLYEEGLRGDLVGVDYSNTSVEFAKSVADDKDYDVSFLQSDLLISNDKFLKDSIEKFDLVLDKGTLDAIALNDEIYENGMSGVEIYPINVTKLVKRGGVLLITSCNFTESELTKIITSTGEFSLWKKIRYPTFEFGGQTGSTICSIAFMKN